MIKAKKKHVQSKHVLIAFGIMQVMKIDYANSSLKVPYYSAQEERD